MNVLEAVTTRRSTRKFKKIRVEKELVDKIIEAGRMAPSGGNVQLNHFIVVQKEDVIERLVELVEKGFSEMDLRDDMSPSVKFSVTKSKSGGYRYSYNATNLIIVCNRPENGNNYNDSACALQNMMLECNELDLGSCWVNQLRWLNGNEELNAYLRTLGMKDNEIVYGSIIFGYPDNESGIPVRRPQTITGNEVTYVE